MSKVWYRKDERGYSYKGDLVACVVKAQKEYDRLNKKTRRIAARYGKAMDKMEQHVKALECAREFVRTAALELARKSTDEVGIEVSCEVQYTDGTKEKLL